jgi:succinate dehydrogenase / fumarate reductase iron-sulfur subunit
MSDEEGFTETFEIFRGDEDGGEMVEYTVDLDPGMVVLDAIHEIQAEHASDLAVRWNCKAGKCGSCSAEVNGKPKLTCMTRIDEVQDEEGPITVRPVKTFPTERDLVTDMSWNYEVKETITPFQPREMTEEEKEKGEFKLQQEDIDRVQEFRKCIECNLCQNTCHVLREHQQDFLGPRNIIRVAGLEMHPADTGDRISYLEQEGKQGFCNITKCCTEVCPADIEITDNAIIPMKERVASEFYDPVKIAARKLMGADGPEDYDGPGFGPPGESEGVEARDRDAVGGELAEALEGDE